MSFASLALKAAPKATKTIQSLWINGCMSDMAQVVGRKIIPNAMDYHNWGKKGVEAAEWVAQHPDEIRHTFHNAQHAFSILPNGLSHQVMNAMHSSFLLLG